MYDYLKGVGRIDDILNNNEGFEELDYIPSLGKLTHKNGFYVNRSAPQFNPPKPVDFFPQIFINFY